MIVQCPSCGSRYRVNDANVPSSGGKITCPSCEDKFIVYPGDQPPADQQQPDPHPTQAIDDPGDATSVSFRPDLLDKMSGRGPSGEADDEEAPATEVMSGDSIPNFMSDGNFGADADETVEMRRSMVPDASDDNGDNEGDTSDEPLAGATDVISEDLLAGFDFGQTDAPANQGSSSAGVDASSPPAAGGPPSAASASSPPNLPPAPQKQRVPSAPASAQNNPSHTAAGATRDGPSSSDPAPSPPADQSPPADTAGGAAPASSAAADQDGVDPTHDGPWKLKTSFGLTYEFPDTDNLDAWLSKREDLNGYELSGGEGPFFGLDAWPQLNAGGANASQETSAPAAPPSGGAAQGGAGADADQHDHHDQRARPTPADSRPPDSAPPPTGLSGGSAGTAGSAVPDPSKSMGKKIEPNEFRPPTRDGEHSGLLWGLFALLSLVAIALVVQLFGIYDIKGTVLGTAATTTKASPTTPAQPSSRAAPSDPNNPSASAKAEPAADPTPGKADPKVAKQVNRLLEDASRAMDNNRLQTANEKLENAKLLAPERVAVYQMLAKVYTKMGQPKQADSAREKVGQLQSAHRDTPPGSASGDDG